MKNDKPFISVSQQIYKLRSQGLIISNTQRNQDIFRTHSYYSLVNGYCDLLTKNKRPRIFKEGATFDELLAIFNFDRSFRLFLFPQILFIEEKIKATCINVFCGTKKDGEYSYQADDYLKIESYDTTTKTKEEAAKKLIKDFKRAIKSNIENQNPAFVHAYDNYSYIPFWILTTNLSFGQISRFYESTKYDIRSKIAYRYHLSERDLRTALKVLNTVRNLCAHNNRIYLTKIPFMFQSTIGLKDKSVVVDERCKHRFGSVLYALKFLLSDSKFKNLILELSKQLSILKRKLKTIQITDVLKRMGISPLMAKTFGIIVK